MSIAGAMRKQVEDHQRRQVAAWSSAALGAAAEAAPSPRKTDTSTGRAGESLAVQPVDPPTWDPGKRAVYRPAAAGDAPAMLADWKPGEDVCLGYGVGYDKYFDWMYKSIEAGHEAGLEALRGGP